MATAVEYDKSYAIVLYIIIWLMASDYHFGIFKCFVYAWCNADLHSSLVYQDQIWYQQNVYNKSVSEWYAAPVSLIAPIV
jgi:hypothetical protein